jgi:protein-S-isoprenylcysteine O-methyltransferase Ste14
MTGVAWDRWVPTALTILLIAQEVYAGRRSRADAQARDRGSLYVVWLLMGLGYFTAFSLWGSSHPPGPRLARWALGVGAAVALAGMALRVWSVRTLGRYFTFVVKVTDDQPVIQTGPYRLLRHPSYAGALLTGVGLGLSLRYAYAPLIIAVPQLLGLAIRMRVEERALAEAIGEPYRAYMRRTKRIVPFIW